MVRLLILGKAGSGKDTLREFLTQELSMYDIYSADVGTILRTRNDVEVKQVHENGGIVPTTKVMDIFEETIKKEHYILSGSPRRPEEAQWFIKNDPDVLLIYLKVSDEVASKRLLNRGRWDDTEEVIKRRLEDFNITEKSIALFKEYGKCLEVNAEQAKISQIGNCLLNQLRIKKIIK